jgi:hypothetical protein
MGAATTALMLLSRTPAATCPVCSYECGPGRCPIAHTWDLSESKLLAGSVLSMNCRAVPPRRGCASLLLLTRRHDDNVTRACAVETRAASGRSPAQAADADEVCVYVCVCEPLRV